MATVLDIVLFFYDELKVCGFSAHDLFQQVDSTRRYVRRRNASKLLLRVCDNTGMIIIPSDGHTPAGNNGSQHACSH